VRAWAILIPELLTMQLEFHQLDRRWEHLRVHHPHRQRRLMASLAECGQQTPIIVVLCAENRERYLVIDGHKRIAALQQLGWDTIDATVWTMSEAEALLLERSLRLSPQESALEQGWLLTEMEQRFGYSVEELGRRFDRSVTWVSRRLGLVEVLPEAIQQQVREGKLSAQLAMKYLVPMARIQVEDCERMAAALVKHHCNTRQAGQLYAAWRDGTRVVRARVLAEPELFLKTQRQTPSANPAPAAVERDLEMALAILRRAGRRLAEALPAMTGPQQEHAQREIESARRELDRMTARIGKEQGTPHAESGTTSRDTGTECAGSEQTRDCPGAETVAADGAQSASIQLHPRAGDGTGGESRTLPPADPGSVAFLQGKSRASP
jgi:ParB family transcriptional regulator, chromosome partitioning protein